MESLEIFLKAFEKRTPKQKQEYIYALTKENNILRKQNINLNKQLEMLCNRYNEKINKTERK